MKTLSATIVTVIFLINTALGQANAMRLTGSVTDDQGMPLPGVSLALLHASDSSLQKTGITKENGTFIFEDLKSGRYLLIATYIGFKRYLSSAINIDTIQQDVALPNIKLQKGDGGNLKELTVIGQKPFLEQKIDRTIVNVEAMVSNTGTNALEVLQKSPGIVVDENGEISLKGKSGVVVYIDNKPTYLSGSQLASYLKSLPAGTLEKIEIMTNPPARYDASGNAGVINILTKRAKIKGFNGNIAANYSQGIYWRTDESLNINFRSNKIAILLNASYNNQNTFRKLDLNRNYFDAENKLTSIFQQTTRFKNESVSYNAQTRLDYYVSDKTTIGVAWSGLDTRPVDRRSIYSQLLSSTMKLDSTVEAANAQFSKFTKSNFNLNFSHQFDSTGKLLTVDLDYIHYDINNDLSFENRLYLDGHIFKSEEKTVGELPTGIKIYSAKADYSFNLFKKIKAETGVKTSYVSTDNQASYFDIIDDQRVLDYDLSNQFIYKENINAGYINLYRDIKRFSFQLGLRLENTISEGHQLGNAMKADSSFKRDYTNLFPTFYMSYKLDSAARNQLIFSYGRRISRPYYQDLNPFISPLDKFSYFAGNPFLKPEFSHNFEFSWFFKSKILTTLMYNYATDLRSETIEQTNTTFISRPGNIGTRNYKGISVNVYQQFTKWWSANIYTEVINNHFNGMLYGQPLSTGGTYWYSNVNNQFRFGNGWSAELSGFYITKSVTAQFDKNSMWQLNTGLQKSVLKDKGTLKLSIRDIFHSIRSDGNITNIAMTTASFRNYLDTQVATIGFVYNFGKNFNQRQRKTGSAQNEQKDRKSVV